MRVIAGRARGTKLKSIDLPAARPTLDRVKESIFSSIQFDLKNAVCLDAFACTGALGIEALSRGASKLVSCERDKRTFQVLKENLQKTRMLQDTRLYNGDVFDYLSQCDLQFDFVFADPPYHRGLLPELFSSLLDYDCLKLGSVLVCEHEKELDFSGYRMERKKMALECLKQKDFSDTRVSYLRVGPLL